MVEEGIPLLPLLGEGDYREEPPSLVEGDEDLPLGLGKIHPGKGETEGEARLDEALPKVPGLRDSDRLAPGSLLILPHAEVLIPTDVGIVKTVEKESRVGTVVRSVGVGVVQVGDLSPLSLHAGVGEGPVDVTVGRSVVPGEEELLALRVHGKGGIEVTAVGHIHPVGLFGEGPAPVGGKDDQTLLGALQRVDQVDVALAVQGDLIILQGLRRSIEEALLAPLTALVESLPHEKGETVEIGHRPEESKGLRVTVVENVEGCGQPLREGEVQGERPSGGFASQRVTDQAVPLPPKGEEGPVLSADNAEVRSGVRGGDDGLLRRPLFLQGFVDPIVPVVETVPAELLPSDQEFSLLIDSRHGTLFQKGVLGQLVNREVLESQRHGLGRLSPQPRQRRYQEKKNEDPFSYPHTLPPYGSLLSERI